MQSTYFALHIILPLIVFVVDSHALLNTTRYDAHVNIGPGMAFTHPLPHFWELTGWCPPDPPSQMKDYSLQESNLQNHAFIAGSDGIGLVRIHNLLNLVSVPTSLRGKPINASMFNYTNLFQVSWILFWSSHYFEPFHY